MIPARGQVLDGATVRMGADGTITEAFDYIIVGSGAAGATAARVLADTGASIAIVEEGPAVDTHDFGDRAWPALRRLYRGMGSQAARGRGLMPTMPIMQGRCVGGSTVVNSGIVWRLPEDVWAPWATEHGLAGALPYRELEGYWNTIERELGVSATPSEAWGESNRLLADAAQRLAVDGAPTHRAVRDCQGSARCQLGCPHGARQSMLVTYLPYALDRGATLFASAKVERVVLKGRRAVGVVGHFHDQEPKSRRCGRFTFVARKAVLVAASAIQTPGLLARSGVRSPHLGAHLQVHPGMVLTGVFDRPVNMWAGATQGYSVPHHRQDLRCKIETLALPPELLIPRLPGVGLRLLENIASAGNAATWAVLLRAEGEGSVRERRFFGTDIHFELAPRDVANLRRGLRFAAELFFAAGARAVLPGVHGLPERVASTAEAALLENGPDDPACYPLAASHLFGTARMAVHPQDGVVGTDFGVHGLAGLYVVDSSVFPTNIGVNPQHTIVAVAMHAARCLVDRAP